MSLLGPLSIMEGENIIEKKGRNNERVLTLIWYHPMKKNANGEGEKKRLPFIWFDQGKE